MNLTIKILISILVFTQIYGQTVYEEILYENGQEIDTFAYQLPENFNPDNIYPLLIAFHQWGGNHLSTFSTTFDEEANSRNWIFMSPFGGSSNNYNHQEAQEMVKKAIEWLMDNYHIDKNRIYAVGGSMGGASGMIYANNHLNPNEPMIAATASASGILDCERRAIEMDGNNSMTEWFGGNYDEVPFEYHRNSAVYFEDYSQSMHYNLKDTPLYLDFGISEPHRIHAEDLYNLMIDYNNYLWIDTIPTGSHGYSVIDENHTCDWLSQFELQDNPDYVNLNLDEPNRAYWLEPFNQFQNDEFIRIIARKNLDNNSYRPESYSIYLDEYLNSDSLILHILDENHSHNNTISLYLDVGTTNIGFSGNYINYLNQDSVYINTIDSTYACNLINFNYNNDSTIVWAERYDLINNNICLSDSPYYLTFLFPNTIDEYNDINQDGLWNVLDILLLVNHIIELNTLTNDQATYADLNNDGFINILDIMNIVIIILTT